MPIKIVDHPKSPNFYIRGTVRGRTVYETTGTDDRAKAEEIRAHREAELFKESVYGKRITATFMQAAASYLEQGGSARFLGTQSDDGAWSGLIGHFMNRQMSSINQEALDDAAIKLYPKASPDTRNRQVYTPFIAVWNHAARNEWCDARDWSRPRKPKGTRVRTERRRAGTFPVPYERAAKFVTALWPLDAINMTILFYTGMRPIELITLEDSQVDIKGRWITLPASKTGEPRGVPIAQMILPIMKALTETFGGIIINRFNQATSAVEPYPEMENAGGQFGAAIRHARRTTGIEDVSPYTGRHSVSTYLVAAGVHPYIKDQILGHAVTDMSRRYTSLPQKDLIKAIDKLPRPKVWSDAELVKNPWTEIEKVLKLSSDQSDRIGRLRPW